MADKDDDFDEWLDDVDGLDSELDQDNIDELLSAVETEDNAPGGQADDETTSGELDQDNIDALLGLNSDDANSQDGDGDAGVAELDQDNIDALLSGTGYDADAGDDFSLDELNQDNIDALLDGSSTSDTSDDQEETELAQDNIDALLADSATDAKSDDQSQSEFDQDDIDSLLSSTPQDTESTDSDELDELFAADEGEPGPAAQEVSPQTADSADLDGLDQDNIDALLNDKDTTPPAEEDNVLAEPIADDGKETTVAATEEALDSKGADDTDEFAASAFDAELDDMDQLFAEIDNDIDDDDPFQAEEIDFAEMLGQTEGDDQEFIELGTDDSQGTATGTDDFMVQSGAEDDSDIEPLSRDDGKKKKATGLMIPAALAAMNRGVLAGIGGGVALLLLIGLFFLFSGPEETMEANNEIRQPVQQPPRKMVENFIPSTENASYDMGSKGGELAIELTAMDKDDQPLIYEITSQPLHGRLSGTAPLLTYLPDNTFPGKDRFEFAVSDGTDTSSIAVITITGPDLITTVVAKKEVVKEQRKEKAEKKIFRPQRPKVLAKDARYFTISTGAVTIDWARLWQEANNSPYGPQEVHVEIVDTAIKGTLTRGDRTNHLFTPDPYIETVDTIRYRFKKGGFRSATKTVSINVKLGSPAPEINIANLADGYLVGQNIIIDATGSRDEARESLQFIWEQVAGVKTDLRPMNKEGSKIAFTMPSSFYSDPNSGPTIVVTAVDNTGKEVRREIKVKMVSRRQTALWRSENGKMAEDPPMQGRYFPWPFDD